MLPILLTNSQNNIRALIVGGGRVALRRTAWLLQADIHSIDLIAPQFIGDLKKASPLLNFIEQPYQSPNLNKYTLILACTDNTTVNDLVEKDARAAGILFNRADNNETSDFFVPAVIRHDTLTIAVNSGIPALSRLLKEKINDILPEDIAAITGKLRIIRNILKASDLPVSQIKHIMQCFTDEANFDHILSSPISQTTDISEILQLYSAAVSHPESNDIITHNQN